MKRSSTFAFALLGAFGTARASPVCTTGPVDLAANTVISCGGLTFSNFGVVSAAPGTNPAISFVGASSTNGNVTLNFNPGLSGATEPQDLWFYFAVSGTPVDSVQLTGEASYASAISGSSPTGGARPCYRSASHCSARQSSQPQPATRATPDAPRPLWVCSRCAGPMMIVERFTAAQAWLRAPPGQGEPS